MPIDLLAEVIANTPLSHDYNVIAIAAPAIASAARPGQFVMVKATQTLDPLLRRPFSIFEIIREPGGSIVGLSILSKRVGPSTSLLSEVVAGDRVGCLGPLGQPWPALAPATHPVMVAGGVGLAPFATLAEQFHASGVRATLVYGARRRSELFYLDFFRDLGIELVLTTEDGSFGERGLVTAPLERLLTTTSAERRPHVFACGPEKMMAAVARLAAKHATPCHVSMERIMGCGMGGCYSCVVPVRRGDGYHHVRSCVEGPVMAADEIIW